MTRCVQAGAKKRTNRGAGAVELVKHLKKAARVWPWLAAVSCGLLYTGCFPPFDYGWLCWLSLTPLLCAIWFSGANSRRRWLRDLLLGYVAGVIFFWTIFSWLTTVTVPGWFLLQFYFGVYFAIWGWVCGLLRPHPILPGPVAEGATDSPAPGDKWSQMLVAAGKEPSAAPPSPWLKSSHNLFLALLLASTWVTMEWLRGWDFSGWNWNGLGAALHAQWPIIQIAEFTGVAGLSFVVAFVNVIAVATVLRIFLEARYRAMKPHYDVTLTMSALVGLLAFGWHVARIPQPSRPVRVAAIQANIARAEKFNPQFMQKIFDQFTRLSSMALQSNPPPDLLVWPESSMPGPVLQDEASNQFVMDFAASTTADVLMGTIDVDASGDYNAALLVSGRGQSVQLYRKLHLVPFGEYIPLRHAVPLFARIIGDQVPGDFAVGTEHTVFQLTNKEVRVAPLICFEDTIGDLVRRFVLPQNRGSDRGANLLVNVTNDGWFKRSAASRQHLANAVFRCVETRRPMVRAANTGVTCFINEYGRVTQILRDDTGDTFAEGVLIGEVNVPVLDPLTFYTRYGEVFAISCVAVTVLGVAWGIFRSRIRRKSGKPFA